MLKLRTDITAMEAHLRHGDKWVYIKTVHFFLIARHVF
jgi:hypothetical protein